MFSRYPSKIVSKLKKQNETKRAQLKSDDKDL